MLRKLLTVTAVAALCAVTATPAIAGDQDFTLHNDTGFKITKVYVEPESNTKDWGDEMLDGDSLANGEEQDLEFSGYGKTCVFGILVTDAKGKDHDFHNVDLCRFTDIKLYRLDGRLRWKGTNG